MKISYKRLLITLSLVFSIVCPPQLMFSQQLLSKPAQTNMTAPQAIAGSTAERKAAWEKLSSEQQTQVLEKLRSSIENNKATALKENKSQDSAETESQMTFVNILGFQNTLSASKQPANSQNPFAQPETAFDSHISQAANRPVDPCPECEPIETPTPTPEPTPTITPEPTPTGTPTPTPTPPSCSDADSDGLDDCFETNLSDGFTPFYYVSAGENAGTGFSLFYNSVPQTVSQTFGATPPISHYRVKPLRFEYGSDGVLYGLVQIDYLTLWNRDDGLAIGSVCTALTAGLGLSLDGLGAHNIDNERSAMLVAAPVVNNSFNSDVSAYNAYAFFTAAHENTFGVDQSLSFYPYQPVGFGQHISLGFSKAKHSTYPFNPDYLPIFQDWVIYSTYLGITLEFYFSNQTEWDYYIYLAELYAADTVFFTCVVEHFQEQGGVFSGTRINVGELSNPINNSGFIQDTEITDKFQRLF